MNSCGSSPTSICFRPTNTPMPWSTWTTRSPTLRSRKSERNVRAAERRRSCTLALLLEDVGLGPELQRRRRAAGSRARAGRCRRAPRAACASSARSIGTREDVVVGEQLDRALGAAGECGDEERRSRRARARGRISADPVLHAAVKLDRRLTRRRAGPADALAPSIVERLERYAPSSQRGRASSQVDDELLAGGATACRCATGLVVARANLLVELLGRARATSSGSDTSTTGAGRSRGNRRRSRSDRSSRSSGRLAGVEQLLQRHDGGLVERARSIAASPGRSGGSTRWCRR